MKMVPCSFMRPDTETSAGFLKGMSNRMATSYAKYGHVGDAYPAKVSAMISLLVRLISYMGPARFQHCAKIALAQWALKGQRRTSGNTEYLIDAANFAMIEFMYPPFSGAHFTAEDSAASPGRSIAGALSQEANTLGHENMRRGAAAGQTAGGFYTYEGD